MEDPVSSIASFNDWRLPYIGRPVNDTFKMSFSDSDCDCRITDFVRTKKFAWEDAPDCTTDNCYDSEWCIHYLRVDLYDEGPLKGCVKSIGAYHTKHWHTDSNWQDHSESSAWQVRDSNYSEISDYCAELNRCTIDNSKEIVFRMFQFVMANSFKDECQLEFWGSGVGWKLKTRDYEVGLWNVAKCINPCFVFVDFFLSHVARSKYHDFRDVTGVNTEKFLEKVNVVEFYRVFGVNFEAMKTSFIDRIKKDNSQYLEFIGMSEKVWQAMISAHFDEVVSSRGRAIGVGTIDEECSCRGMPMHYNEGYKNWHSIDIPKGSLCYFNCHCECIGFVSPNDEVHYLKRGAEKELLDIKVSDDGNVYDGLKRLGGLKGCGIDTGADYLVWVGEYGEIIKKRQYLGYVKVFTGCQDGIGKEGWFDCYSYKGSDLRLVGLFFPEYVTGDELEDCRNNFDRRKKEKNDRMARDAQRFLDDWREPTITLADSYDDPAEVELNTRGDGYD